MFQHAPGAKGQEQEARACRYLQTRGLVLRERNYRCRHGEIDPIMYDGDTVVSVEVRYRANPHCAGGAETVDRRKQSKLAAAAAHYLQGHHDAARRPARFDGVALVPDGDCRAPDWSKYAFQVEG